MVRPCSDERSWDAGRWRVRRDQWRSASADAYLEAEELDGPSNSMDDRVAAEWDDQWN